MQKLFCKNPPAFDQTLLHGFLHCNINALVQKSFNTHGNKILSLAKKSVKQIL